MRKPQATRDPIEDQAHDERAALQCLPYLRETGWIGSHLSRSSIDAAGHPIPWYRYAATDFLDERIARTHRVFEFGTGNSTLWWASKAKAVTAVEHEPEWAARMREVVPQGVEVIERPLGPDGAYSRAATDSGTRYEIIVIDGRERLKCASECLPALTDDGVIVWDDSHRRRYRPGLELLRAHGFRRLRFTGLGPIAANDGETSVLYRATNCFKI